MSKPITYINTDLPGYMLQRRRWIQECEAANRNEDHAAMEMLAYFTVLMIVVTACAVAWVVG